VLVAQHKNHLDAKLGEILLRVAPVLDVDAKIIANM